MKKRSRRQLFGFLSALGGLPIVERLGKAEAEEDKPRPKVEIVLTSYRGEGVTTCVYKSNTFMTDKMTRGTTTYFYYPCHPAIFYMEANRSTIVYDVSGKQT